MAFTCQEENGSTSGESCIMLKDIKPFRFIIFFMSVIALSRFFEAGRLISSEMSFAHLGISVISALVFLLTLFLMGYWVYSDEKEKNNLKIKFGLYEWLYNKLSMRKTLK